jgi:predicted ATPase
MKKIIFASCLSLMLGLMSCSSTNAQFPKINIPQSAKPLTDSEVASGLKEALTNGITKGAASASRPDGYYRNSLIRIPFPPEIQQVETRLRQIGMGGEVDKFVLSLNRAAEDAAISAKPIFISAIRNLTISDVWGILRGEKDAATQYLIRTTSAQLTSAFKPTIKQSLDKVHATRHYGTIITSYNQIPMVQKVNPDLEAYATQKAIDGLFILIAQEEANIRQNPVARTSDLLRRVFARQ